MSKTTIDLPISPEDVKAGGDVTVWKVAIDPEPGVVGIDVPFGAELLSAREQGDNVAIWFRCNPSRSTYPRKIALVETGKAAPTKASGRYLGTAVFGGGAYVLHVFEPI